MKRPPRNRKRVRSDHRRERALRESGRRLSFESLEDRRVLATMVPLELTLESNSVAEDAGAIGLLATVSRPSDQNGSPLIVSLISSDTTIVKTPASISIPTGLDSVSVFLETVDDDLLTGDRLVTISAFASGYEPDTAGLVVEDRETILVSIDRDFVLETGPSTEALVTVSRSKTNIQSELVVDLLVSPSDEAQLSPQVTIPAGAASVTTTLTAYDEALDDSSATVTVTGQAEGYVSGSDSVDVIDADRLQVAASSTTTTEHAGQGAIELTISRFNEDLSGDLVVSLASSDSGEIQAPQTVTIPAGEKQVVAVLDAIDDALLDGVQAADIVVSAPGFADGQVTIQVQDHESIGIEITAAAVREGDGDGATTAVLTRSNVDSSELLRVSILNSDASEIVAPSIVEIPAGNQSVTFSIDAIDDLILDGTQQVTLTAMAEGYAHGEDNLDVLDSDFGPGTWTNPDHAFDIDANGFINVADALVLVLKLRTEGPRVLPPPSPGDAPPPWLDANADGSFNTRDPFLVINFLNEFGAMPTGSAPDGEGNGQDGEGEGANQQGTSLESDSSTGQNQNFGTTLQHVGQFSSPLTPGAASLQIDASLQIASPEFAQSLSNNSQRLRSQPTIIQDSTDSSNLLNVAGETILGADSEEAFADLGAAGEDSSDSLNEILDEFADDVDDTFRDFDSDSRA